MVYAAGSKVASDRSRSEIEKTLARYGASSFMYGWDQHNAVVAFVVHGRQVRIKIGMLSPDDVEFRRTPTGLQRNATAARDAYEQACRQRWRALSLVVKAKLEAVQSGIATFEDEFLAYVVLPDNNTVSEWLGPQLETAYALGSVPSRLALGTGD